MAIDHDAVRRRAAAFTPPRPGGTKGLLVGVHRDPALATWLPWESEVLPPVPARAGERWELWSLVAVAQPVQATGRRYAVPWGAVCWELPAARVAQLVDLRRRPDLVAALAAAEADDPARWSIAATSRDTSDALLDRLDALLGDRDGDVADLAPYYAAALPPGLLDLYAAVVPVVVPWLLPAGGAVALDTVPAGGSRSGSVLASGGSGATPGIPTSLEAALSISPEGAPPVGSWLRRAVRIGDALGVDAVVPNLGAVRRRREDAFRLVVAGPAAPLRHAVDLLLGVTVLPAGPFPPLTVLRSADATLDVSPDLSLPLTAASWDRVPAEHGPVRVRLDAEFLRSLDGEIDLRPDGSDVDGADALLLVTPASSALGLAEREFLDAQLTRGHVPRAAVLLTGLEEVDADEREGVLRYVTRRVEQVRPDVDVLVLPARESADALVSVPVDVEVKELRDAVLRLGDPSGRNRCRERQVLGLLVDHVAGLMLAAAAEEQRALEGVRDRAAAVRAAEQRLGDRRTDWLAVRTELHERGARNTDALRRSLLAYREDLLERLRFEVRRSRDPQQWWTEDLPFRLRRELEAAARRYEGQLESSMTRDLEWLDERCRELFGRSVASRPGLRAPLAPEEARLADVGAPDLARYRLGFRVAPAVAGLLGVLFLPGGIIAMGVASAAALAAGELRLQGMLAEQHDQVAAALPGALDRAIDAVSDQLSARVRELYAGLLADVERGRRSWQDSELAALRGEQHDDGSAQRRALATEARELLAELRAAIDAGGAR